MAPHSSHTKSAPLSFSSSGDNVAIAGISGVSIKVYCLTFTVSGATSLTFKDSIAGNLSGGMALIGNGSSMTLPMSEEPWFSLRAGADFVMNSTNGVSFGGVIWYTT